VDTIAVPIGDGSTVHFTRAEYVRFLGQIAEETVTEDGQRFVLDIGGSARGEERRRERRETASEWKRAMWPLFERAAPAKVAGRLSPMNKCGWSRWAGAGVTVRVDVKGHASLRGVVSCGRRTCPVCGPRLLARDADLIKAGVKEHGYARTLMATMTVRHYARHRLLTLRKGIVASWVDLQRQRAFKDLLARYGGEVFVRVVETTHRHVNGWHVHYHVLVFVGRELSDEELEAFDAAWSRLWQSSVVHAMGAEHRPTLASGVKLTRCPREGYLTKLGLAAEVTDVGQAKEGKGRSYWRIVRDWCDAGADLNAPDARLLVEYIRDTRAARIVEWPTAKGGSEYTRKKLDARHPEDRPPVREETSLHAEEWDAIRWVPGGPSDVRRAAELAPPGLVEQVVRELVDELLRNPPRPRTMTIADRHGRGPPLHRETAPCRARCG
jgi:hypothetical protein